MKNFALIIALTTLLAFNGNGQATSEENSEITQVTVFTSGAQVTREAEIALKRGESVLVFSGLSRHLDPNSIQVKGNSAITLLGVEHQLNYLRKSTQDRKIDSLQALLDTRSYELKQAEADRSILQEELNLLNANRNLGGQQGLEVSELRAAMQFYREELNRIKSSQIDNELEIQELTQRVQELRNQIGTLTGRQKEPTSDIRVKVLSPSNRNIALTLTYFTYNAGWKPSYDLRVKKLSDPVELEYRAGIFQYTGEDWDDVSLTLSNAAPTRGGNAPELSPWYLQFYNPQSVRIRGASSLAREAPAAMDAEPSYPEEFAEDEMLDLDVTIVEGQTSFRFEVPGKYTVPSNAGEISIDMKKYEVPAEFEYYAAPSRDRDAFLMAKVYGWEEYALQPGKVNLYFEDGFVGSSHLNPADTEDTLHVSLGRDRGIIIEREAIENMTETRLIGANKVENRGYEITVRNNKNAAINLRIVDQVPVSTNNQIEINNIEYGNAQLNERTGILTWRLNIPSRQSKKVSFRYEVKYPKDQRVIIP